MIDDDAGGGGCGGVPLAAECCFSRCWRSQSHGRCKLVTPSRIKHAEDQFGGCSGAGRVGSGCLSALSFLLFG